jgi:hypothetical protein
MASSINTMSNINNSYSDGSKLTIYILYPVFYIILVISAILTSVFKVDELWTNLFMFILPPCFLVSTLYFFWELFFSNTKELLSLKVISYICLIFLTIFLAIIMFLFFGFANSQIT